MRMPFSPIPEVLDDLRAGKPVVLVDDEDRENEGDVVYAAEKVTPEAVNVMMKHVRGMICLALTGKQCDHLRLHSQAEYNTATMGTAFTVTVDAHPKFGVSTGVSARDRATTVQVSIADDVQPGDLLRPGHMNPLRARDGGVLVRAGHTEGSVALARLEDRKRALMAGYQRREGPIPLDASYARRLVVQDTFDRVDLVASYATRLFDHRVKFQLNVDNVGDEFYADRFLGYAEPRRYRLTFSTNF